MIREKPNSKFVNFGLVLVFFWYICCCVSALSGCLTLDNVLTRARFSCVVALTRNGCATCDQYPYNKAFLELKNLSLSRDLGIYVDYIDIDSKWPNGKSLHEENIETGEIVLFRKLKKDRTCLLPSPTKQSVAPVVFSGVSGLSTLVDFVNDGCETYLSPSGEGPSIEGLHRNEILRTMFHVKNISDVQSKQVFHLKPFQYCEKKDKSCLDKKHKDHSNLHPMPKCEKVDLPTKSEFFHNYVKISKPVIFRNVLKNWPAFSKWSNKYLREKYGKNNVHIKLTPLGEYEGVEPRNLWENHQKLKIPQAVLDQLPFPDMVVVRPATKNLNFSSFMDLVEKVSNRTIKDMSAYLEYSSIPDHLPELEEDIIEESLFPGLLKRDQLNIWLSDGQTLGKLHFDQYDNLLCQVLYH